MDLAFSNPLNPTAHQSPEDPENIPWKITCRKLICQEGMTLLCCVQRNGAICSTSTTALQLCPLICVSFPPSPLLWALIVDKSRSHIVDGIFYPGDASLPLKL